MSIYELGRDRTPPIVRSTTSIRSARLETFLCTIYVPLATGCDRHIAFAWKPLRRTDIAVASRSVASREPCREGEPVSVPCTGCGTRHVHGTTARRRAAPRRMARGLPRRAPHAPWSLHLVLALGDMAMGVQSANAGMQMRGIARGPGLGAGGAARAPGRAWRDACEPCTAV